LILAGDIGGTKTNLALFEPESYRVVASATFASRVHPSLEGIVEGFVASHPHRFSCAGFGVAGPVSNGKVFTTNLAWRVEAQALAKILGLTRVAVLNDLEANAYGIAGLAPEDFVVLNEGRGAEGNAAVIAAGTGLGEAGMFWDGRRHRPFACEGGHGDFAPTSELEVQLLRHLQGRFGRVSCERILSGPGLLNVFEFLREARKASLPSWLEEQMRTGDPSAAISRAALEGKDPLCDEAVELFVRIYGAEAGNWALKMFAVGGVYVGGGIGPKLVTRLQRGSFLEAFVSKGRMRPLLEAMPLRLIMNDKTALLGAARFAAEATT
jgi:glucokinase